MSTSRADVVLNQKKYSIEPSWVPLREAQLYAWRVFVVCIYEPPHVKRCWNCRWSRSTFCLRTDWRYYWRLEVVVPLRWGRFRHNQGRRLDQMCRV